MDEHADMEEYFNDYPWPDGEYVHFEPMGTDKPILTEVLCLHCGESILSHFQDGRGGFCKK